MATQMDTLNNVRVGKTVTKKINGVTGAKRRIMDMGLTKGTGCFCRKVAPLGDPIELTVRGHELSVPERLMQPNSDAGDRLAQS